MKTKSHIERPEVPATKLASRDEESTLETHPSYGLIGLSRFTCTPAQAFFGSATKHHSGISITIKTAEKERRFSQDKYYARKHIMEINITEAQLGELIANMNRGDGVPCTFNWMNGDFVPNCPETTERELIQEEFKRAMKTVSELCSELVETANAQAAAKTVNKTDRTALAKKLHTLECQIANNMPFISSQFSETIDQMLVAAKADLASYTQQILEATGVDTIKRQQVEDKSKDLIE